MDELFYGGAKGGSKTETLIARPLYNIHKPLYAGAFVRSTFRDLLRPMDRMHAIYNALPANQRPAWDGSSRRFTFPSGAIVQVGYTEHGLEWSQGGNWAEILWDEMGNEPDEQKLNTLQSEVRCKDRSIPRQIMGSGNPGFAGHPWIKRRFIKPCGKDGGVAFVSVDTPRGKRTRVREFIPSRVTDNPYLSSDEDYMTALYMLPDRMRRCLLEGDWDAATGMALDEVQEDKHIRAAFSVPAHWPYVAAFDWGFAHNAVFIHGRVSEDGRIFVVDTIKRRLLRDWDLAGVIEELAPIGARTNVQAGTDTKSIIKAREEQQSTKDTFLQRNIHLVPVNHGRVFTYRNLLTYLSWRGSEYVAEREPMLQFFDTPGNRWLVEQLQSMVHDPDDPRDVLKVDAHAETGEGGDDGYDALRMLVAQKPLVAKSGYDQIGLSPFDPSILLAEATRAAKFEGRPDKRKKRRNYF